MKWPFTRQPMQARIVSTATDDKTLEPGKLIVPGVVSLAFSVGNTHVTGADSKGNIIMAVPAHDVALAVVEEITRG